MRSTGGGKGEGSCTQSCKPKSRPRSLLSSTRPVALIYSLKGESHPLISDPNQISLKRVRVEEKRARCGGQLLTIQRPDAARHHFTKPETVTTMKRPTARESKMATPHPTPRLIVPVLGVRRTTNFSTRPTLSGNTKPSAAALVPCATQGHKSHKLRDDAARGDGPRVSSPS
jgi:hypothetical protein